MRELVLDTGSPNASIILRSGMSRNTGPTRTPGITVVSCSRFSAAGASTFAGGGGSGPFFVDAQAVSASSTIAIHSKRNVRLICHSESLLGFRFDFFVAFLLLLLQRRSQLGALVHGARAFPYRSRRQALDVLHRRRTPGSV